MLCFMLGRLGTEANISWYRRGIIPAKPLRDSYTVHACNEFYVFPRLDDGTRLDRAGDSNPDGSVPQDSGSSPSPASTSS
jgi:hypothetical protein